MAAPRIGTVSPNQVFTWSNNELFQGAAILGIAIPTVSGSPDTVWPQINLGETDQKFNLPKGFAKIPIIDGKASTAIGAFFNEDITPPNTQYVHYIIDSTNKVIAGPGALFSISTSTFSLPALTLTAPTVTGAVLPVPD